MKIRRIAATLFGMMVFSPGCEEEKGLAPIRYNTILLERDAVAAHLPKGITFATPVLPSAPDDTSKNVEEALARVLAQVKRRMLCDGLGRPIVFHRPASNVSKEADEKKIQKLRDRNAVILLAQP